LPQPWNFIAIPLLMALELAVPAWAERGCKDGTPWHAHHIAERYGLMTIIVLGECVLGTANDVASVYQAIGWSWQLGLVGLGGLGLVLCLWWIYFLLPSGEALHNHRERAWGWGYAHFFLFGSIAAMGSGLQVVADVLKHAHPDLTGVHAVTPLYAILSVALPQLVFMAVVWFLWTYASQAKAARRYHLAPLVLACLAAVVLGVAQGLPLAWALPLLCLAPILTITYHSCGQQHRGGDYQVQ
ncbi:MAG: low temperature requirement protein A, partial [Firmicutes bacterium]|nr:low temperature requirement protein A [Bacillota bacterium]